MPPPDLRTPPISMAGSSRWRWLINRLAILSLVALGLMLVGLSRANPQSFGGLRGFANDAAAPVLSIVRWPVDQVQAVAAAIGSYFAVRNKNQTLERELADLKPLREHVAVLTRENRRLKALLGVVEPYSKPVVVTRIVGASAGSYVSSALAPVGARAGVRVGQPVRDADGLVGRVVEVGTVSARILLLSDLNSRAPVKITRTGVAAIVAGANGPLLRLRYLPQGSSVQAGDTVVTSGHGGLFPPGIPVGRVVDPAASEPTVMPVSTIGSLDYVTILTPFFPASAVGPGDMASGGVDAAPPSPEP